VLSGRLLSHLGFSEYIRPLGVAVCACVMYAVIMPLSKAVASKERKQEAVRCAASACFNIPVFACALITAANHYSLLTTALYALGLCAGFLIGAMLVAAARRRLNADSVPAPFRGLPATLLCLAGMALGLQALSAA
jgi:Na+-translocating ferredoxin:NAD+ oxidoreductase RnfA subunit